MAHVCCSRVPNGPECLCPCSFLLLTKASERRKEKGSELSCCKPQLSLMRDKDKRLPFFPKRRKDFLLQRRSPMEGSDEIETSCGEDVGSFSPVLFQQLPKEMSNGLNSDNNNCDPTTYFKCFSTSVPFFLSLFTLSLSSSIYSLYDHSSRRNCSHQNHNYHYKDYSVQYINCNKSNEKESQGFFSEMMKMFTKKIPFCVKKTAGKRLSECASKSCVPYFVILFLSICAMVNNSIATPIPNIPSPTHAVISYQSSSSFPISSGLKRVEDIRRRVQDEFNKDGVNESREIGKNMSRSEIKPPWRHSSFTTTHQQMSRSISRKSSIESEGEKETLDVAVPITMEMKKEHLISNPKLHAPGPTQQQKQHQKDALVFVKNDLISEESIRKKNNNEVGRNEDDDNTDFIDNKRISLPLINKGNSNKVQGNDDAINTTTTVNSTTSSMAGSCWYSSEGEVQGREQVKVDHASKSSQFSLKSFASTAFVSASTPNDERAQVWCNGSSNLASTLDQIPDHFLSQVISIHIKDSSISNLNLSLFERFPRLVSLSVTHSNVSRVIGNCPRGLLALNISFNAIRKVDSSVFHATTKDSELVEGENETKEGEEDEDYRSDTKEDNNNDSGSGTFSTENILSPYFSPSIREKMVHHQNNNLEIVSDSTGKTVVPSKLNSANLYEFDKSIKKTVDAIMATPLTKTKQIITSSSPRTNNNYFGESEESQNSKLKKNENDKERLSTLYRSEQGKAVKLRKSSAFPAEQRSFSETTKITNEEDVSHNGDDDENNDPDNDHETKLVRLEQGRMTKESEPSPTSFSVGVGEKTTSSAVDCTKNNHGNNSLCKLKLEVMREDQKGDTSSDMEYEDEEDHHLYPSVKPSGFTQMKSESYTFDLDQDADGTSEGGDDYSLQDPATSVLPSLASSSYAKIRRRRSNGDGDGEKGNEMKVGSEPTSSQLGNVLEESVMNRKRSGREGTISLQDVDLSHNKISEVPRALLELKSLDSLRLSGNQLKCDFVWEKLAEWYMNSPDKTILKDGDDTFCGVVDDVRVFQFTVLGVLKAKKDVVETCNRTVDKSICHDCGLYSLNKVPGHGYNLSHESPHGNVAIALKLDCSFHSLSELPAVPPQTWQLNVSGNSIKDLSSLKEPMYENLLILDADSNEISSLDGLTGTTFLEKYNYLSLQNNRFSVIPSTVLSSLKNMRGQGVTFLGANFIDCDCDTVREIKPLLLENSKKIKDLKEIYCKNMKTPLGDAFMALKDVQYTDLCYMDTEESSEIYLYLIIFVELLLIFVIVAKVWHDQRTFRRTGILPWCSAKMPRLPCDAMLESVKEPPHFNRSSSMNVRSFAACGSEHPTTQSISSHVQLREVRSNSGQSEKSSQISQLSSFPSSSRTSSV